MELTNPNALGMRGHPDLDLVSAGGRPWHS